MIREVEQFQNPLLPACKSEFCLVLDLDETLIHYIELPNNQGNFLVRPGAREFLAAMSEAYELVIFTAA